MLLAAKPSPPGAAPPAGRGGERLVERRYPRIWLPAHDCRGSRGHALLRLLLPLPRCHCPARSRPRHPCLESGTNSYGASVSLRSRMRRAAAGASAGRSGGGGCHRAATARSCLHQPHLRHPLPCPCLLLGVPVQRPAPASGELVRPSTPWCSSHDAGSNGLRDSPDTRRHRRHPRLRRACHRRRRRCRHHHHRKPTCGTGARRRWPTRTTTTETGF